VRQATSWPGQLLSFHSKIRLLLTSILTRETPRTPRDNKFKVVIRKSSTVALQTVEAFVKGKYRLDNDVIVGITFLDHLMRETPSNKFLSIKRSFFEGKDSRVLSGGVEAWKGIFQSVRATQGGRLTLNVDVATSVFWSAGSVLDIVTKHLRCDCKFALARFPSVH
jgi:eukaryotic translation initiation factor 2C